MTSGWAGGLDLKDTIHFWKVLANPQQILRIPLALPGDQWLYLKAEAQGKHARMWYQCEGIDEDYILVYDARTLIEFDQGKIGIWAGGQKVWVDYVHVYGAEGATPLAVQPRGRLALTWAEAKNPAAGVPVQHAGERGRWNRSRLAGQTRNTVGDGEAGRGVEHAASLFLCCLGYKRGYAQ